MKNMFQLRTLRFYSFKNGKKFKTMFKLSYFHLYRTFADYKHMDIEKLLKRKGNNSRIEIF